jgi:cellulose synthase (UDP-forming)
MNDKPLQAGRGNSEAESCSAVEATTKVNLAGPRTDPAETAKAAAATQPEVSGKSEAASRLSALRQIKLGIARITIVLAVIFTARYFYWRATATMNPAARWFFYIFLVAEAMNFLESLLFYFTVWAPTRHAAPSPLPGQAVDVFITTYNESVELLRETVLCATNMRYPHTTYVLDDGNRPEVKQLAEEFGCQYLARIERTHAKAGNLNHGLQHSKGAFIVTLDADHIPSPDLIEQIIGFFRDENTAAVQTAQDFYNHDSYQHKVNWRTRVGWQQQELFFNVLQPGKDRFNAAFYCGSPAMLRRSALEKVGGFATETITEDMHTGLRLQKKKLRVVYHNKTLAFGLAPQTYIGFATQWHRWGYGCMQVMRTENPVFGRGLTLGQRVCYFASMYFYWISYQKLLYLLTPIMALLTGIFPLITTPELFVKYFFPYFFLNLLASVQLQGGFRSYFRSEQFNFLKLHVLMGSILGLFRKKAGFKVTPKSRANAASLSDVLLPALLCVLVTAAIIAGLVRLAHTHDSFMFWALGVNTVWAAFYLLLLAGVVWSAMRRQELRASYRFPDRLDVRVKVRFTNAAAGKQLLSGYARNMNRNGFSLTTDKPLPPGTTVEIEINLPGRVLHATGEVMRNTNYKVKYATRIANGIQFTSAQPRDLDEISKYLFWQIAPREMKTLQLTHMSQREE